MLITIALLFSAPVQAGPCGANVDCVVEIAQIAATQGATTTKTKPAVVSHRPTSDKKMQKVYDRNATRVKDMGWLLRSYHKRDIQSFYANWQKNKARYERVAAKTGVPAELIAALHWRESTGSFKKYLHQGDPLGKAAVRIPTNIPIFHDWEKAAVHAINMKKTIRDRLSITQTTVDPVALATFAEYYNGLGYHYKGKPSPYVFSGTDQYTSGKYIRDKVYSSKVRDRQLGVMAMVQYLRAMEGRPMTAGGAAPSKPDLEGSYQSATSLRRGDKGKRVEALQGQLQRLGFYDGKLDGDYGRGTQRAVKAFQDAQGISDDGVVGKGTQGTIDKALSDLAARDGSHGP